MLGVITIEDVHVADISCYDLTNTNYSFYFAGCNFR